jgi:phage terminase large subunit-like protein
MAGEVVHDGNPCLRWNLANVVVKVDDNENIKPSKKKSADRIDGTYAFIMAIAAMENYEEEPVKVSCYDQRAAEIEKLKDEKQEIISRVRLQKRELTADELHRIDEITLELEKLEREFMPTINW